jgi:basic membrane lipoprotein Med (substrate-binding protein (PBP1-ABC) superfamily)
MLTSAIKRVDTAVFETIKAVVEGTFVGAENREFGLAEDGVGTRSVPRLRGQGIAGHQGCG